MRDEHEPSTQAHAGEGEGETESDEIFAQEQRHLTETWNTLAESLKATIAKMDATSLAAAADKTTMVDDVMPNFAGADESLETYVDYSLVNNIIDVYNATQTSAAEKLIALNLLLKQPYFAKIVLQYAPDEAPKELYIGNAGATDESYKRLVVDWRSPVAEVYYNQANGPTSYRANGREINVDLKLRRQFDIEAKRLNAYFDTTVAIQDELLLASLSERRSAKMQAITATIQKEQNLVVRHDDVDALLVGGIAGSGKTSVLLQRIAYLFYQKRDSLDPREVVLITPNPLFRRYIDGVLPDMGERNPQIVTWREFAEGVMPPERAAETPSTPLETLWNIDKALANLRFENEDFRDIRLGRKNGVNASQIRQVAAKFKNVPAGPHLVTLMREELAKRLENRLKSMAASEEVSDELSMLSVEEQLRIFGEVVVPIPEDEESTYALRYLNDRYADAIAAVENDEWLRIDRIGMRLLGTKSLSAIEWMYLKIGITGAGDPNVKYVMVDEVQDYTAAQIAVLARYFRRAHFLLLGDEHQAIKEGGATFDEIREVFARLRHGVEECSLLTSYRSSPEITALFAGLLDEDERGCISSVQRESTPPEFIECADEAAWEEALARSVEAARAKGGTVAVVTPWTKQAKRVANVLGDAVELVAGDSAQLPEEGVAVIPLALAKGLEFDHVIVPDASEAAFPDDRVSRNRLYTTISRATRSVTLLTRAGFSPMLRTQA